MIKAKYKIGELIKTKGTEENTAGTIGLIDGVLITKEGVKYVMQDESTVLEIEVVASYVERKPRATRKPKASTEKNAKKKAA